MYRMLWVSRQKNTKHINLRQVFSLRRRAEYCPINFLWSGLFLGWLLFIHCYIFVWVFVIHLLCSWIYLSWKLLTFHCKKSSISFTKYTWIQTVSAGGVQSKVMFAISAIFTYWTCCNIEKKRNLIKVHYLLKFKQRNKSIQTMRPMVQMDVLMMAL